MAKTLSAAVRRLKQVDPGLSDRELLARHAAGDPDAFAALVRRHGKTVLAACRPVMTDPADLDDAFQATFVVLLKKAKSVAWQPSLSSWLYAVAHRIAVHARCNQARRTEREAEAGRRKAAASPDLSWRDAVAVLHEELDRLPEGYRRVLLLCYLDGQSRDEAAANLGLKPGAVKGRLERGRALLASRLTRRGVALSAGLLAVLAGNSTAAAGGPSAALIDLTVQAGGGALRPAVTALANGAFPVATTLKRSLLAAVLAVGLIGAGLGLGPRQPAAGADEKQPQKAEKPAADSLAVHVVDEDGRAVAGAKVWVCQSGQAISPKLPAPRHAATADPDGRCVLSGQPGEEPLSWSVIAATKDGYGPGFVSPAGPNSGGRTLTLVKDDVPITGVILNLQGQPVAGASVQPLTLHRSDAANLDDWEKAARRSTKEAVGGFRTFFPHSVRLKDGPLADIGAAVKTDRDGRFTLHGLGRDRLVTLRVSGPGIATQEIEVVTRATATIRTPQDPLGHHTPQTYYGAKFDLAVEPVQPFVGVVTDKETGKPVRNVVVRPQSSWDGSLQAVTDANGKYRLDGLRTGEQDLIAVPPIDTPYHLREFKAGRTANEAPVTASVELIRGVWVSGTVTDKATGKPVAATVSYRPTSDDADLVPGYLPRGMHDLSWYGTDKNGRFRVLALRGEGFVFVRARQGYLTADQLDWQGDLKKTEPRPVVDSAPAEIASNWNAVGLVTAGDNPKEYAFTVDLGVSMKARVTDPDGKPLAGARVTQRTNFSPFEVGTLDTAAAVFERVNPKRPRPVLILHPGKHLGAVFRATPAGAEPADIRLKPTGKATGRLLTEDGKPLANTPVEVLYTLSEDSGWRTTDLFPQVTTDAAGKFTVPNLVEGVRYELRWPRPAPKKASGYHPFTVTSGEEKKLGDVDGKAADDSLR